MKIQKATKHGERKKIRCNNGFLLSLLLIKKSIEFVLGIEISPEVAFLKFYESIERVLINWSGCLSSCDHDFSRSNGGIDLKMYT